MTLFLALLIGIVAGLRAMTAPACVAWAAAMGWMPVAGSWAAFMGYRWTPWIFSVLAVVEFVWDQLPNTPSRKSPPAFASRIVSGGFCGAVLGTAGGTLAGGLIAGAVGAVLGTLGGYEMRRRLVQAIGGNDRPIAFLEDAVAIALGLLAACAVA